MADNGGGQAGGNGSVYWSMRHGGRANPQQPAVYTGSGAPPRGNVSVRGVTEGHSNANFTAIGQPDHPGMFKVILRFRDADWAKVPAEQQQWLDGVATRSGTDRVLTVLVPAIQRAQSANGQWPEMPWEIQWEW